ncbi:MAG TPA: hypothetical protein VK627_07430 [Edaphobacter sp.]|nr:hypothetical protein [Edaphobacter sp.]
MLRWTTGARKNGTRTIAGALAAGLLMAGAVQVRAQALAQQGKLGPAAPVTYNNRYEVYGGLSFMNFQAGQSLPKRMNLGGGEVLGTYWVTKNLGVGADYRLEAGTTPVFPNTFNVNRPLVYMNIGMLGAQYRGPKNQHAALNYHAYFGVASGVFDSGLAHVPTTPINFQPTIGLYTNRTKPIAALGVSLDFNRSKNFAIRLSPDLILEHFGSETRQFFAISGGVVYRFGKR